MFRYQIGLDTEEGDRESRGRDNASRKDNKKGELGLTS